MLGKPPGRNPLWPITTGLIVIPGDARNINPSGSVRRQLIGVVLTLDLLIFEAFVAAGSESVAHAPIVDQAFVVRARLVAPDT